MTNSPKNATGSTPFHHNNSAGKRIGLYDRDAACLAEEALQVGHAGSLHRSQASVWYPAAGAGSFVTLVSAQIGSYARRRLQLAHKATQHLVLASGQGKGIAVKQHADGTLLVYCMLPGLFNSQSGCNVDFSSDDSVRQYLKTAFAGWHHIYHEALATAHSFSLVSLPLSDIVAV